MQAAAWARFWLIGGPLSEASASCSVQLGGRPAWARLERYDSILQRPEGEAYGYPHAAHTRPRHNQQHAHATVQSSHTRCAATGHTRASNAHSVAGCPFLGMASHALLRAARPRRGCWGRSQKCPKPPANAHLCAVLAGGTALQACSAPRQHALQCDLGRAGQRGAPHVFHAQHKKNVPCTD